MNRLKYVQAMEYLVVRYPETRGVLIDDRASGVTNQTILVNAGTHKISLAGGGFHPPCHRIEISGTTSIAPREVSFERN